MNLLNHIHWSSVKEKSLSIESISTRFVKLFIDVKLDLDIDFSLSAQNLSLIFWLCNISSVKSQISISYWVENSTSEDQFSHNTQKIDFEFTANSRRCRFFQRNRDLQARKFLNRWPMKQNLHFLFLNIHLLKTWRLHPARWFFLFLFSFFVLFPFWKLLWVGFSEALDNPDFLIQKFAK